MFNSEKRFKVDCCINLKHMSIFPADVSPSQLAAFLRSVYASDGVVHVHKLALDLHWDLTKLLPIIDAAEMLGLVTVEKGEAKLSMEGHRMFSVRKGRRLALANSLLKIEPFRTALRFKRKFSGEDVAKELTKKGIRWHHEDEVNSLIVGEILMHWGVRAGLLDYDGSGFKHNIGSDSSS
jgi:NitT/TauT family transport system ATP-binding protein